MVGLLHACRLVSEALWSFMPSGSFSPCSAVGNACIYGLYSCNAVIFDVLYGRACTVKLKGFCNVALFHNCFSKGATLR